MLKLEMLPTINAIVHTRDVLLGQIAKVESGRFTLVIEGCADADVDIKRSAKPAVLQTLRSRLDAVEAELREQGVEFTG